VTNAELVGRARALRPLLAAAGEQGAEERRVPDKCVQALTEAGLFKVMVPRRYGGHEGTIRTLLEVSSAVAEGDGAAGWVVSLAGVCAWMTSLFPGQAQDEVFGADADAVVCGSGSPLGSATPVEDGWLLSGTWSYISGSTHAGWAVLGFLTPGVAGQPGEYGMALVPMSELTLTDTWFTSGMRATGSNTLTAESVFIPRHRVLPGAAIATSEYLTEFKDEVSYRAALFPFATLVLVGPLLGIGRAALEHVRTAAATKGIAGTMIARQADSAGVQLQLAEAALRIDTAHLHAFRAADDIEAHAVRRAHPELEVRTRIRADASWAAQQLVGAVTTLVNAHGSGAFALASPLHRMFQDLSVGARHAMITPGVSLELYGKTLLGAENDLTIAI
jgi:alkylation response protein AidB-like acyl-CoA dehydrogenase